MVPLILASASPRRAELLRAAGFAFEVRPFHIDESIHDGEPPRAYVRRLAAEKARVAAAAAAGRYVLAADTAVVVDEEILGKPEGAVDAARMLRRLAGRAHHVLTGVCLVSPEGAANPGMRSHVEETTVEFAPLSTAEIEWYVATGEPMDKAGAYAIQGFASRFVQRIHGSYSNVVGLPVSPVYGMCREAGLLLS